MLSSKTKRELKIDQRKILIDSIEIGIPSPQQILTWGERVLPNGKKVGLIKNSKTVNYKRFTPFRDGLFCERIFGPVTSFVCACGKKQPHNKVSFCEKCEVEYIDQRSRRYRLGYISLLSPVTHIWYLKGRPSYLSLFLGKRKKTILALAYCNAYLVEHGFSKKDDNAKSSNGWLKNKNLAFREEQNLLPLQELNLFYPKLEEAHAYKAARLTGAELCFASGLPLCKTNGDPTYLSTFQKANLALTRQRFGRGKWFTKRSFVSHQDNASCSPRTTPTGAYNCLILSHVAKRKEFRKSKQLQNTISLGRGSFRKSLEKSKEKQCPQRYVNSTFTQGFWAHHLAYKAELCKHRPLSKKMTRAKLCKTKKYKAVQFQSSTYNSKCNYKARTKLLTNLLAITNRRFVRSFALVYNYKCKAMNTKLGFVSKKICNCLQSRALYKICQELYTFNTITSAITKCTVSSYGSYSYTRQHTLPFLPSLVSHFYLRDALLGFIYSLAAYEDFPLVEYCDTHRREPLRDVHRFMAHKTVDSLKKPFSSGVREYIKNFSREIHSLERVRSYKIDLGQARQDLFLPGKKCRFQVTKQVTKHGFVNRSFQGIKSERKMSRHFKSAFLTKHAFGQKKMHPPENQRRLSEDNKKSLLSGLELTAIREILSYTGGGALQQLLQQFNQYDLCKFLFAEAQILRVFYETQISNGLKTEQAIASYEHTPFLQTENLSSVPTKPVQGLPLEMQLQRLQNRALLANNYKCKKICQKLCTPYKASRVRALLTKQSFVQDFSEALLSKKGLYTDFQNNTSDLQKKQILRLSRRIYKVARRLKTTQLLSRNHRKPEWMILSHLPVLPPDLRPILQMSEKVIVASDLNIMYQRVIYRNNRHLRVRFIDFHLVTAIQRLVQDAVDRLIENGKGGSKPYYTQGGRPLKSLSDILKGKKGRFRLNLLGKRVDFSGRSVIVVSPACQIHECGLPKAIALELYHYFLLRQLIVKRHCASIVTAKKMIKSKSSLMWDVLRELMYHHPVLLNRAPTLHRLGIQAFQPKLVLGNAILLHPLVCSGFNADFDGDQMGVHLPLSFAARAESWDLLWSRNNLLSPATGQPMLVPSQDMVLGFYYITAQALQKKDSGRFKDKLYSLQDKTLFPPKSFLVNKSSDLVFSKTKLFLNLKDITATLQSGKIKLHQPVWVHWNGKIESEELSQKPLEIRVQAFGLQQSIYERYVSSNVFVKTRIVPENDSSQTNLVQLQKFGISAVSAGRSLDNDSFLVSSKLKLCCVRTTAGRVLMNNLILMSDKYKSCTYKAKLC